MALGIGLLQIPRDPPDSLKIACNHKNIDEMRAKDVNQLRADLMQVAKEAKARVKYMREQKGTSIKELLATVIESPEAKLSRLIGVASNEMDRQEALSHEVQLSLDEVVSIFEKRKRLKGKGLSELEAEGDQIQQCVDMLTKTQDWLEEKLGLRKERPPLQCHLLANQTPSGMKVRLKSRHLPKDVGTLVPLGKPELKNITSSDLPPEPEEEEAAAEESAPAEGAQNLVVEESAATVGESTDGIGTVENAAPAEEVAAGEDEAEDSEAPADETAAQKRDSENDAGEEGDSKRRKTDAASEGAAGDGELAEDSIGECASEGSAAPTVSGGNQGGPSAVALQHIERPTLGPTGGLPEKGRGGVRTKGGDGPAVAEKGRGPIGGVAEKGRPDSISMSEDGMSEDLEDGDDDELEEEESEIGNDVGLDSEIGNDVGLESEIGNDVGLDSNVDSELGDGAHKRGQKRERSDDDGDSHRDDGLAGNRPLGEEQEGLEQEHAEAPEDQEDDTRLVAGGDDVESQGSKESQGASAMGQEEEEEEEQEEEEAAEKWEDTENSDRHNNGDGQPPFGQEMTPEEEMHEEVTLAEGLDVKSDDDTEDSSQGQDPLSTEGNAEDEVPAAEHSNGVLNVSKPEPGEPMQLDDGDDASPKDDGDDTEESELEDDDAEEV